MTWLAGTVMYRVVRRLLFLTPPERIHTLVFEIGRAHV